MDVTEICIALIQHEVDCTRRMVGEPRGEAIDRGVAAGIDIALTALGRRVGFAPDWRREDLLRARLSTSRTLPMGIAARIDLPPHLGSSGETVADYYAGGEGDVAPSAA